MVAAMSVGFVSCSTDDGTESNGDDSKGNGASNVGVSNIFKDYLLSTIEYKETWGNDGWTLFLSYESGRLVKVTKNTYSGYKTDYTFDYSKIGENKIMMSCHEEDLDYSIEMILNEYGFVSKSYHSNGEWYEFTYNKDKRINCMKQHHKDGEVEITYMTYTNGDLVKVEENDGDLCQIAYTSRNITSPIKNVASLMYKCDLLWGVDFDEYNFVYMAGLLGMAPAHLPVSITRYGGTEDFEWILNEDGTPAECSFDYRIYKYYWDTISK